MTLPSSSSAASVGKRVFLIVFWTIILVLGIGLAALVSIPNLGDLVQGASQATIAAKSAAVAAAVAMFILGLWGITSAHRAVKNSVGILTEVDRARKETIELERGRVGGHLK